MSFNYLRKIEHAVFPLTVTDEHEIYCVAVLKAAGMIEALLPESAEGKTNLDRPEPTIVRQITAMGRAALARHPPP
jgi:hypothetical protein